MATKNIVPRANKEGQLGTDAKQWNKVIAHTGSFQVVSSSLIPDSTNTYDLGSTTKFWKDIYVSSGSIKFIDPSDNSVASTLSVDSNGTFTLGDITLDSVISSSAQITGLGFISSSTSIPDGTVSSSVQIDHDSTTNFVSNEHIDHTSVTITAGTGLTGGGTIAASRTLNVVGGDGITANADDIQVDNTVLRTTGGNILSGSAQISTDISGSFTAPSASFSTRITNAESELSNTLFSGSAQVDHDSTTNFVANEHIDHSSVTITAGSGLTGGGDITTSRTLNIGAGTGITVNANDIAIGQAVATNSNVTFGSVVVSNDVTINGNLSVLGDATELQVSNLRIEDKLIEVASGSADSAAADGAGILIGGANESLKWNHGSSTFQFSDDLYVSGSITLSGTVDGRDIATDGTKLDTIETNADVTDTANVTSAGALMDSELSSISDVKALNQSVISGASPTFGTGNMTDATNKRFMTDAQETKLDSVESSADVTDSGNVHPILDAKGVLSGSAQIATDISGSFTQPSGSFSLRVTTLESGGLNAAGDNVVSSSVQITHDDTTGFVANEHIDHSSVSITAGNGLTGGGTIASTRTINVGAGDGISVAADSVAVDATVLRTTGDSVVSASAQITHDSTTGFVANEHIDHSGVTFTAGTGLTGGGTIAASRTFNVVGGDGITANADDIAVDATVLRTNSGVFSGSAQITHDSTTGFVANEHIDHSSVSITAGNGLTGGGTIAASRTIDIGAGTGIDVAADAISVDVSDFMTNGANNRVLTATGTDAMNAESGLTYDGSNLDVTGGVRATGDVVAYYSSDKRLKDNIVRIENPLEKVSKIGGYTYDWNDKQNTYEVGSKDFGVIAQEIQEVLPELVTERDNGYLAVKYEKIVPLLIESIKELKQEIDDIKQKCDCLNK